MAQTEQTVAPVSTLQCSSCGATLQFAPGTHHLTCQYCGGANEIADTDASPIVSFDFADFVAKKNGGSAEQTARVVSCKNCGASTTLPPEVNSDNCVFCASPLVLSEAQSRSIIRPHYILPFLVPQAKALEDFRAWLKRLWWAPSDLTGMVSGDARQFKGIYVPHWSYDAETISDYSGSRGDYYYITETYTEQDDDGNTVEQTREVRQTAWTPVSGRVGYAFNDVLISASNSLPQEVANRLEPWKLESLVHYNEQYVSGFRSELFQVDAEKGLEEAKRRMQPVIRDAVVADIGGDEQVIDGIQVVYSNLGLKYLLLPAWISTYKYNNKVYHFTVNACTGEVVGERPYSAAKITLAVIAGIVLLIFLVMMFAK
jgi:LSD1 subclass zinc finger protein